MDEAQNLYRIALNFKEQSDIYNYMVHMIMAANNGHNLAVSHIKGEGFEKYVNGLKDRGEEIKKFLISTKEYNYSAAFLGLIYLYEGKYKLAKEALKKSEDNPVGLFVLGIMYQEGKCYPEDLDKAINYFELSIQQNYVESMNCLGILYSNGKNGKQNYERAKELFETAINLGSIRAISLLAGLYCLGRGVPKDIKKAKELTELAVKKGDVNASVILGLMWQDGRGCEKDFRKARELFESALEKNHPTAMNRLLILYRDTELKNERDYVINYFNEIGKLDKIKLIYNYDDFVIKLIKENLDQKNRIKALEQDNNEMMDHIMASPEGSLFFEARDDWKRRSCKF